MVLFRGDTAVRRNCVLVTLSAGSGGGEIEEWGLQGQVSQWPMIIIP